MYISISISIFISIYDILYIYINIMDDLAVGLIFFKVSLPVEGLETTLGIWPFWCGKPWMTEHSQLSIAWVWLRWFGKFSQWKIQDLGNLSGMFVLLYLAPPSENPRFGITNNSKNRGRPNARTGMVYVTGCTSSWDSWRSFKSISNSQHVSVCVIVTGKKAS